MVFPECLILFSVSLLRLHEFLKTVQEFTAGLLILSQFYQGLFSHIFHGFCEVCQAAMVVPRPTVLLYFTVASIQLFQTLPTSHSEWSWCLKEFIEKKG
jgi:hypothetical protein